ncbi:MAG: molybdate ABC transporter substrate-binding protein [Caldimonas sp.]
MHCAVVAALALACATCSAGAAEITVCAAASLTHAFREIGAAFEAGQGTTKVSFSFAASGALLQQIAQGAPVDVFASADQATMDEAVRRRLLRSGSRADFAANSLVVIVPSDATSVPKSLADIADASIRRVAIGIPGSVPVGRYARGALEKAQLWPQIEAKTIGAQSVRQALDYVARGEVDAGFVYATDAALMRDRVKVAFAVPTDVPIRYPIAVVAASTAQAEAQKFVDFVGSPRAQSILAKFGFAKP